MRDLIRKWLGLPSIEEQRTHLDRFERELWEISSHIGALYDAAVIDGLDALSLSELVARRSAEARRSAVAIRLPLAQRPFSPLPGEHEEEG